MCDSNLTFDDVQEVLTEHTEQILDIFHTENVQLSVPTDGKGLRIRISVEEEFNLDVPQSIEVELKGPRKVTIPLELKHDYEDYKVQSD